MCEQVINNHIMVKTGKGQIRVAEGPLVPAFPSYGALQYVELAIFRPVFKLRMYPHELKNWLLTLF